MIKLKLKIKTSLVTQAQLKLKVFVIGLPITFSFIKFYKRAIFNLIFIYEPYGIMYMSLGHD